MWRLFQCTGTRQIWKDVLSWMKVVHNSEGWDDELIRLSNKYKGKSKQAQVLKCALVESIYEIWNYINCIRFRRSVDSNDIGAKIVDGLE